MNTSTQTKELRLSRLWRQMTIEQRVNAADAFWGDEDLAADQAQAVAAIAKHINFRPRSVASLPIGRRSRHLASLPGLSEMLIGRILIAYHLHAQRPMMGAFLDELGIRHEDGLITEDNLPPPSRAALASAVDRLKARYPPADVALYLGALLAQDQATWEGLAGLPELSARAGG
jgi:hypothetical protein